VAIDVSTEVTVARPRGVVASYTSDPDNATAWYSNIKAIEWKTPKPAVVGSRIAFVANFLGRRLAYIYEVKQNVPGELFVMATAEGPFPMETTYAFEDAGDGATKVRLRNRGEPSAFPRLMAPLMAGSVRRANRKDLARLKQVLEARPE
jgi:uncharacterized membrane protein